MQKYKVYINNKVKVIDNNWERFCHGFNLICAAGGIVFNKNRQILMIYKNGKWDLPKGKIDKGEVSKDTAIREVREECGIKELKITSFYEFTYHVYQEQNISCLKRTDWYLMETNYSDKLTPQLDEGIEQVIWVDPVELSKYLDKSFLSIKHLLENI
ncbi:MAG: NUDIX hydrolase [Flavobacteriales bacterium]|nr:NUDIX hydrolase [Flavobacteriales bacterium]|tara:strand:- start:1164 stop:1634 length:471 start_codon:yes stop_codon:yes gene_type:complete